MSDISTAQEELIEEFRFFDNWIDRYQYIIDMGRRLPELPEEYRTEDYRLHGCQSQVWLVKEFRDGQMQFRAISDSAIVSGLIAILMRIYDQRTPEEIVNTPPDFIAAIGLDQHLSPTRSTGLNAMIRAIKGAAADNLH